MALDIRHLRAIVAIAHAGSVSRAATELGMTQPSLTALLQRLERQLGTRLFHRDHAGAAPTDVGERLVTRAAVALAEFDQLEADLYGDFLRKDLRIGLAQMDCLPTLVGLLEQELGVHQPTYTVESGTTRLSQGLSHRHQDLAVVVVSDDAEHQLPAEVGMRVVFGTVPVFVALPASRWADHDEVRLEELAEESWICPPGAEDGSLAELRAATIRAGFEPRVRFTFPHGGGRQLISEGAAVQLVEPSSPELPGMVVRPLVGDPIRIRVVLAWRRGDVPLSLIETVYRSLRTAYSAHARRSAPYMGWWLRRREEHLWARQLDAVLSEG